jgi:hypothetical protein
MIDWSKPKEEIDWSKPKPVAPKGTKKSSPNLKDVFQMAYGPKAMQERREFETQARQNVPAVAANVGLGALQEVADMPPNIASSFGIPLTRADEGFTQYAPQIEGAEVAQGIGRMFPHIYALSRGYQALGKLTPKNALANYFTDIGKIGGLEYLLSNPEHKGEAALAGAGATAVINPILGVAGRLIGPNRGNVLTKRVSETTEAEKALQEGVKAQEQALESTKIEGARQLGQESMAREGAIESMATDLRQQLPVTEQANTQALVQQVKAAHGDIKAGYEKMYEDFKTSPSGLKPIQQNILPQEIEQLGIGKLMPGPLSSDINQYIGSIQKTKPYTDIIQGYVPGKTNYVQKEGTVQNYLDMSKKARDEALKFERMAKDRNATMSEKEIYRQNAQKFRSLQNMLDERIGGSLDLPEMMQYQQIQDFFKNYEVPFRDPGVLKAATGQRGKIKTNDFFGSLLKINEPKLMERLIQGHPELRAAMTKYDLMPYDFRKASDIDAILRGDRAQAITPEVRRSLETLREEMRQKEMVDKLIPDIGKSELALVKRSPQLQRIFSERPDLRVPFDNIQQETVRLSALKNELERAGMARKDAEALMKEYKESIRGLGSLLSIIMGSKVYYGSRAITSLAGSGANK